MKNNLNKDIINYNMMINVHDTVIVKSIDKSIFNNKTGKVISIKELTGSDAGCGDDIVVYLPDLNYDVHINMFSSLYLEKQNS